MNARKSTDPSFHKTIDNHGYIKIFLFKNCNTYCELFLIFKRKLSFFMKKVVFVTFISLSSIHKPILSTFLHA